jgi:hypothetical protein
MVMRRALFMAARRAVTDPRVRAKAMEVAQKAKPAAQRAAASAREAAKETPPARDPGAFARGLWRRLRS